MARGKHSSKNKIEIEKDFTSLQESAIIASMACLDEAFFIARKKKDVTSLIEIADKWYGLSREFDDTRQNIKHTFGFSLEADSE